MVRMPAFLAATSDLRESDVCLCHGNCAHSPDHCMAVVIAMSVWGA